MWRQLEIGKQRHQIQCSFSPDEVNCIFLYNKNKPAIVLCEKLKLEDVLCRSDRLNPKTRFTLNIVIDALRYLDPYHVNLLACARDPTMRRLVLKYRVNQLPFHFEWELQKHNTDNMEKLVFNKVLKPLQLMSQQFNLIKGFHKVSVKVDSELHETETMTSGQNGSYLPAIPSCTTKQHDANFAENKDVRTNLKCLVADELQLKITSETISLPCAKCVIIAAQKWVRLIRKSPSQNKTEHAQLYQTHSERMNQTNDNNAVFSSLNLEISFEQPKRRINPFQIMDPQKDIFQKYREPQRIFNSKKTKPEKMNPSNTENLKLQPLKEKQKASERKTVSASQVLRKLNPRLFSLSGILNQRKSKVDNDSLTPAKNPTTVIQLLKGLTISDIGKIPIVHDTLRKIHQKKSALKNLFEKHPPADNTQIASTKERTKPKEARSGNFLENMTKAIKDLGVQKKKTPTKEALPVFK